MNENAPASVLSKVEPRFVWQRLETPFPVRIFGYDGPGLWWALLIAVLFFALLYVVLMYLKDARGVGLGWASLLGLLRLSVYAVLAVVFLMPAKQYTTQTESRGKVLMLFDVSESMTTADGAPLSSTTRLDNVVEFLTSPQVNFLPGMDKKVPVTAYRFGSRLDEDYLHFADGRVWTKKEREAPKKDGQASKAPERKSLNEKEWRRWLTPAAGAKGPINPKLSAEKQVEAHRDRERRLELVRSTNIADSVLAALNRETGNNRVNGVIVFTDGRHTEATGPSPNVFHVLRRRVDKVDPSIPVFVVAIGEERHVVKIAILKTTSPPQVQPEDSFPVNVEINTKGLADQVLKDVVLEVTHTRKLAPTEATDKDKDKDKDKNKKDKDGKGKAGAAEEREVPLPIYIIPSQKGAPPGKGGKEGKEEKAPAATGPGINLGLRLLLRPEKEVRVDRATGRAVAEFTISPETLAAAAGKAKLLGKRKWELKKTEENSALRFQVLVPTDAREGLKEPFHKGEKRSTAVVRQPTRILLFASAATRDFQFLQAMLVREMEKNRMEVSVHLQLPPGETKVRPGLVMSVPKERLLRDFPDTFDPEKRKNDPDNLNAYDVLICFDPDWKRLTKEQIKNVVRWANTNRTGLIYVGGHFNTVKMAALSEEDAKIYGPLVGYHKEEKGEKVWVPGLLPVEIGDRRLFTDRKTDVPWPLDLKSASPNREFMRLDERLPREYYRYKITDRYLDNLRAVIDGGGRDVRDHKEVLDELVRRKRLRKGSSEEMELIIHAWPLTDPDVAKKKDLSREQRLNAAKVLSREEVVAWLRELPDKDETFRSVLRKDDLPVIEKLLLEHLRHGFLRDWDDFFYEYDGTGKVLARGFYNFYPVKSVPPGSEVVARFGDPKAALKQKGGTENLHPLIVVSTAPEVAQGAWIGSTETWRLRELHEEFHEVFWIKLIRYASRFARGPLDKRVRIDLEEDYKTGERIKLKVETGDAPGQVRNSKQYPKFRVEVTGGTVPPELAKSTSLTPLRGFPGYFSAEFRLPLEGDYRVSIDVPDILDPEGTSRGQTRAQKFRVLPSNPELDDTRPDYTELYGLASEVKDAAIRLGNTARAKELEKLLPQRPKLEPRPDRPPVAEDKKRLYFDLKTGKMIPEWFRKDEPQKESAPRNTVDLWDGGVTIYTPAPPRKPIQVSYVLLVVVVLLSAEWLIRKLLRLA
jgi:hypothetical protein